MSLNENENEKRAAEELTALSAFVGMLKNMGVIPNGMSDKDFFDHLSSFGIVARDASHTEWDCDVKGDSGSLQGFYAMGTVHFAPGALQQELGKIKSITHQMVIPAGTMVIIKRRGYLDTHD